MSESVARGEWTFINRDEQTIQEGLTEREVREWEALAEDVGRRYEVIRPDGTSNRGGE